MALTLPKFRPFKAIREEEALLPPPMQTSRLRLEMMRKKALKITRKVDLHG